LMPSTSRLGFVFTACLALAGCGSSDDSASASGAVGSSTGGGDTSGQTTGPGASTQSAGTGGSSVSGSGGGAPCTGATSSDPHNCGGCGHDCLGGACDQGVCQPVVLATTVGAPNSLVVDGEDVFWIEASSFSGTQLNPDGSVRSVPRHGG